MHGTPKRSSGQLAFLPVSVCVAISPIRGPGHRELARLYISYSLVRSWLRVPDQNKNKDVARALGPFTYAIQKTCKVQV